MTTARAAFRAAIARVGRDLAHEVVVNVLAAVALAAVAFVALGGRIEDLYTRARGAAPVSGQVAIVAIDEEALYVWDPSEPTPEVTPRGLLAEVVRFLDAASAKVVVLDILTDQPSAGDDALAEAVRAHGRVVTAERFVSGPANDAIPFAIGSVLGDVALPAYANLGMEERTLFSGEMLVHAVPLVQTVARSRLAAPFPAGMVGGWQDDGAPVPSLALAAAWLARSDAPYTALAPALAVDCGGAPAVCADDTGVLGLPPTPAPMHRPLGINFRGPEGGDGVPTISAARILRIAAESALARTLGVELPLAPPADLASALAGRVVLVGRTDAAAADRFVTPYGFPTLQVADMAGVRIHAHLVDTLLSGHHTRRVDGLAAWGAALALGLAVVVSGRYAGERGALHLVAWLAGSVAVLALGLAVFVATDGLVLDVAPSLAVVAIALIGVHLYSRAAEVP